MNFYEILKTKKLGRGSPDYWTQLFAEHAGGKGEWKVAGVLPLTFTAKGGSAVDWVIYGNDDVGENLINVADITIPANITDEREIFRKLYLDAGTYTVCCYQENTLTSNTRNTLSVLFSDNTRDYESTATNFHLNSGWHTLTFTLAQDGVVSAYVWGHTLSNDCVYTSCMLVKGSTTPDHYIPYQKGVGERTAQLFDFQQFADGTQTTTNGGLTFTRDSDTVIVNNSSNVNYPLVFLNNESGLTVPQLIRGQTYSGKVFISNAPSGSYIYVDVVGKNQGGDWTWIKDITVSGISFTLSKAYDIYGYRLVCKGTGISYENTRVKFVLTKGSTAPDYYIPYGFEIPLTINNTPQTFYIGDSPLTAGQSISKTSTGVDIELFDGENTVSTTLYNKPTMEIKYK